MYAGGQFTNAGGVEANGIAKWNGSAWSALGPGLGGGSNGTYPSVVLALELLGDELYAGGDFTTAGGHAANGIAKWNGSSWNNLGLGMAGVDFSPVVYALAVSGSNLYAGGWFSTAGGSPAANVAKWDGSTWSPLGEGLGGFAFGPLPAHVNWLAISGSDLYAGGIFATADFPIPDYRVAKWNGNTWTALGSGMHPPLVSSGNNEFAGDSQWSDSVRSALGSGLNNPIIALAVSGTAIYVGGNFTMAGGKVSAYVAELILGPPPLFIVTTNTSIGLTNGQFHFTLAGPAGSNAVIFASTNLQAWTPLVTNSLAGGLLNFTDTRATNFTRRFYRALLQP